MVDKQQISLPQQNQAIVPKDRPRGPLGWWFRFSTPDEATIDMTHDIIPRSRLASILIFITLVASIAFIPAALTSDDLHVVPPVIGLFAAGCIAIPLNKRGKVTLVGILIVGAIDAALAYSLLSYPHFTLTQNAIPIYDLFVLSDIIAISLLPGKSIFFISFCHSVFMLADVALQPHTPDLQELLVSTGYSLMIRPLTIQIVVAVITYLWVRSTLQALKRADQAEKIAQLEHAIALRQQELDDGIQQILATLVEAANGNAYVRAPLSQQHALWQVGVGLNTLLARLQRSYQTEHELQQVKIEIHRLLVQVREIKGQQRQLWLQAGGTELDHLLSELHGTVLLPPPQRRR